ncbi:MarC family protein [Rhizobium sp. BK376]|uniref:MarC family protein n=1 Tax=Rhizobium sp. BK376 TaxID=2512149 RepID=UPI00104F626E|nr:MarC family protein [Rhizobium sp. BK376]TCR76714.1 multiple antibiotic resistance protein [Rhizobium sp. BK376]
MTRWRQISTSRLTLSRAGDLRSPAPFREIAKYHPGASISFVIAIAGIVVCISTQSFAQSTTDTTMPIVAFGARKVFFLLFLMLGPIKILVPFVSLTSNWGPYHRRRLARRAIVFSAAALAIAGSLGRTMLENYEISLPVLAMTGGIVLFLVAMRTILHQPAVRTDQPLAPDQAPNLKLAFTPLAFPTIVTPYGIAAVIVFATPAGGRQADGLTVAAIVLLILALDWLAMVFADTILKWIGTLLQVLAVVLGVTQAALGLKIILHSFRMIEWQ